MSTNVIDFLYEGSNDQDQSLADAVNSTEDFQKTIHNLFEKNGIMNDLRAYLRSRIVNALNITAPGGYNNYLDRYQQRLELSSQSINILIVEYLLFMEFPYTFSVFVSEVPLSNMVFKFSKTLLMTQKENKKMVQKFEESDVCAILNYLGVACDSTDLLNILESYKSGDSPLLLCIIKNLSFKKNKGYFESNESKTKLSVSTEESDSNKSSESQTSLKNKNPNKTNCKHYAFCHRCRSRISKVKKKSKENKEQYEKMFQRLEEVYEEELLMVKREQEKRTEDSLATQIASLLRQQEQMETVYRSRESCLERAAREQKVFIGEMARSLRAQHARLAGAMSQVRLHTESLAAKEELLRSQMHEAEKSLKRRGEELRNEISKELLVLNERLEDFNKQRDALKLEKASLKNLNFNRNQELDELKQMFLELKCALPKTKVMCQDKGVVTELQDVTVKLSMKLNNGGEVGKSYGKGGETNKLVNELNLQKNVNRVSSDESHRALFAQSAVALQQLEHENRHYKSIAVQLHNQLEDIRRERNILRTDLGFGNRPVDINRNSTSRRKGAGEELGTLSHLQSSIVVPGESIPFIGFIPDRRPDNTWHLINQWQTIREHVNAPNVELHPKLQEEMKATNAHTISNPESGLMTCRKGTSDTTKSRSSNNEWVGHNSSNREEIEGSPQPECSNYLETKQTQAKHKLNKKLLKTMKDRRSEAVFNEAKTRLRKMEIEAEAVEKSYLDFKRRYAETKSYVDCEDPIATRRLIKDLDMEDVTMKKYKEKLTNVFDNKSIEKYLKTYKTTYDLGETHFKPRNTSEYCKKPIRDSYIEYSKTVDYVGQPITEFRKLYNTNKYQHKNLDSPTNISPLKNEKGLKESIGAKSVETKDQLSMDSGKNLIDNKKSIQNSNEALNKSNINENEAMSNIENGSNKTEQFILDNENINVTNDLQIHSSQYIENFLLVVEKSVIPIKSEKTNVNIIQINNEMSPNSSEMIPNNCEGAVTPEDNDNGSAKETFLSSIINDNPHLMDDDHTQSLSEKIKIIDDFITNASSEECDKASFAELNKNPSENITTSSNTTDEKKINKKEDIINKDEDLTSVKDGSFANSLYTKHDSKDSECTDKEGKTSHIIDNTKECSDKEENYIEDYPDDFSVDNDNSNSHSDLKSLDSPISIPKSSDDENFWDM